MDAVGGSDDVDSQRTHVYMGTLQRDKDDRNHATFPLTGVDIQAQHYYRGSSNGRKHAQDQRSEWSKTKASCPS